MVVRYHTTGFTIDPDDCPDCGQPLYDTGCDAPDCTGRCCFDCGTGCDLELAPEGGQCAQALDAESDEERQERINEERAAAGLSPITAEGVL